MRQDHFEVDREFRLTFQAIIECASVPIVVIDSSQATLLTSNTAWKRFVEAIGLKAFCNRVGGHYLDTCRAMMSDHCFEQIELALAQMASAGRRAFNMRYRVRSADAAERWVQLRACCNGGQIIVLHDEIPESSKVKATVRDTSYLLHAQDDERRRLARGLHDVTAQNLAGALMHIDRLIEIGRSKATAADGRDGIHMMAEARTLVDQSLTEIRTLSYLLHPPLLDELGFATALKQLTSGFDRRSGVSVSLKLPKILQHLPRMIENTLYRVVQEALTNIHRHSGSPTAEVELSRSQKGLILKVIDHGKGLPTAGDAARIGVGISSMRARLHEIGSDLKIRSSREGTILTAVVPFTALKDAPLDSAAHPDLPN